MKNILLGMLLVFATVSTQAERLRFVTLLSQPVGVFSSVDVLSTDSNAATVYMLNVCDSSVNGVMTFSSLQAKQLVLSDNATLGGNIAALVSPLLTLQHSNKGGVNTELTGGSLTVTNLNYTASSLHLATQSLGDIKLGGSTDKTFPAASFHLMTVSTPDDSNKYVQMDEAGTASTDKNNKESCFEWTAVQKGDGTCTNATGDNCNGYLLVSKACS